MVSITSNGVVYTFNDGNVENIRNRIYTNLDFDAMPSTPPDASMLYDFSGVSKIITVSGTITDTGNNTISTGTAITINEQRQWIEKHLNGTQSGVEFDSNYSSVFNGSTFVTPRVLFSTIDFNEEVGNPNGLPFTMTLFVGDV